MLREAYYRLQRIRFDASAPACGFVYDGVGFDREWFGPVTELRVSWHGFVDQVVSSKSTYQALGARSKISQGARGKK